MSWNPLMARTVLDIKEFFPKGPSVLELGSQTLTAKLEGMNAHDVPSLYTELGFKSYDAIDVDGRGTMDLDLNLVHDLKGKFDLVTNNGTGEHVFNQAAVFETMHNACKPGGLLLHILPWINWRNHAFYNFHPALFRDLAEANNYQILRLYAGDRNAKITHEDVSFDEDKKPNPIDSNISLVCLMKKLGNDQFAYPTQKKYAKPAAPVRLFPEGLKVSTDPFPHVVFPIDQNLFRTLEPAWAGVHPTDDYKAKNNFLVQRPGKLMLDGSCGPVWKKFASYCTSSDFLQELFYLFAPHIAKAYPHLTELPLKAGVRFADRAPFLMDCQLALNTAVKKTSTVRGFHIDDPFELIAGLIYFSGNEDGGNLQLGKWTGERKFTGRSFMKKQAEAIGVEPVAEIATVPGTAIFFMNSPDSLHGVTPRRKTANLRRYVNIVVQVEKPLWKG